MGDHGSIPGRVIPKTLKMVLDTYLLNTQRYKVHIKGNPGKGVASSPTPRCSSYRKGSLLVALDYGRQLYFFYLSLPIYIYIYITVCSYLSIYQSIYLSLFLSFHLFLVWGLLHTPTASLQWDKIPQASVQDMTLKHMELRGNVEYPSLLWLPGQLWPRVVAPDRVLSIGQIILFDGVHILN